MGPRAEEKPGVAELKLATQLIESISSDTFDAKAYHDEYRQRVMDVIDQKSKGKILKLSSKTAKPATGFVDLMQRLKDSVAQTAQKGRSVARHPGTGSPRGPEEGECWEAMNAEFTAADLRRILRVSESGLRSYLRAALLPVSLRPPCLYSFQNLVLLRTAQDLMEGGVSVRRIRTVLLSLQRQLWRRPGDVEPEDLCVRQARRRLGRSVPLATRFRSIPP